MERLQGTALLEKIRTIGNPDPKCMAKECGYTTATGRASLKPFFNALLEANGIIATKAARRGRQAGPVSVQSTGVVLIGQTWTTQLGLEKGDKVDISISRGRIVITPIKSGGEDISGITDGDINADTDAVIGGITDGTDDTVTETATTSFTAVTSQFTPEATTVAA